MCRKLIHDKGRSKRRSPEGREHREFRENRGGLAISGGNSHHK